MNKSKSVYEEEHTTHIDLFGKITLFCVLLLF